MYIYFYYLCPNSATFRTPRSSFRNMIDCSPHSPSRTKRKSSSLRNSIPSRRNKWQSISIDWAIWSQSWPFLRIKSMQWSCGARTTLKTLQWLKCRLKVGASISIATLDNFREIWASWSDWTRNWSAGKAGECQFDQPRTPSKRSTQNQRALRGQFIFRNYTESYFD